LIITAEQIQDLLVMFKAGLDAAWAEIQSAALLRA
jgi:hypothetical protein